MYCMCIYKSIYSVYKINTCYIFQATYFQIPVEDRERVREGKRGWRLFGLCTLRTGLTGAKLRLSAPASLSFTQADKYTHTHSWGYQLLDSKRGRAKYTLSQNHAFINTFTHPELFSLEDVTEWHASERLDSLKCCIKGTASANAEGSQWAARTYCVKKWLNMFVLWQEIDFQNIIMCNMQSKIILSSFNRAASREIIIREWLQGCLLYWLWKFA